MKTHSNKEQSHLPFLDALRGLMAVWVVAGHTSKAVGWTLPYLSTPGMAVEIFMMVSGFLMAYYFRVRESREPWESPRTWEGFYIRRFFRIAPAYYAMLLIALIFRNQIQHCAYGVLTTFPEGGGALGTHVPAILAPLTWQDVLAHVTFAFGVFPQFASSTALPDWSIGLEMQFYLVLPFIMLLYRRTGYLLSTALLLAIWAAANHLLGVSFGPPKLLGHFPMPSFLPLKLNCFVVGILLAESLFLKARKPRESLLLCVFSLAIAYGTSSKVLAFAGFLSAVFLVYRGESGPIAMRNAVSRVQRALASRVCLFLADTSYGVYLVHVLVVWPLGYCLIGHPAYLRLAGSERFLLFFGTVLLIAYPVASLLHKYVEQPGIKLGKRFIRPSPPATPAAIRFTPANPLAQELAEAAPQ